MYAFVGNAPVNAVDPLGLAGGAEDFDPDPDLKEEYDRSGREYTFGRTYRCRTLEEEMDDTAFRMERDREMREKGLDPTMTYLGPAPGPVRQLSDQEFNQELGEAIKEFTKNTTDLMYNLRPICPSQSLTPGQALLNPLTTQPLTPPRQPLLLQPPNTPRRQNDITVNPNPPPNLPLNRQIGRTPTQQVDLANDIADAINKGASDIRVNQQQVNALGQRVGVNQPDLQYTLPNGTRVYIEYDNMTRSTSPNTPRGIGHADRILANDPDGVVILKSY